MPVRFNYSSCLTARLCASKFIIQKFRRQIGALSAFFETQKKKTKGRLDRILVISDSSAASEALLRMLDSYYTKDDIQDQYLESRLPYINVFEITAPVVPYPSRSRSAFMEYTKVSLDDHIISRVGLEYTNGRIVQSTLETTL